MLYVSPHEDSPRTHAPPVCRADPDTTGVMRNCAVRHLVLPEGHGFRGCTVRHGGLRLYRSQDAMLAKGPLGGAGGYRVKTQESTPSCHASWVWATDNWGVEGKHLRG